MSIKLYRSILKLHRQLPPELKYLGNQYIKSEFKRHKDSTPEFLKGFADGWRDYKSNLEIQIKSQTVGSKLDDLEVFTPEQLGQLLELKDASKQVTKAATGV